MVDAELRLQAELFLSDITVRLNNKDEVWHIMYVGRYWCTVCVCVCVCVSALANVSLMRYLYHVFLMLQTSCSQKVRHYNRSQVTTWCGEGKQKDRNKLLDMKCCLFRMGGKLGLSH